MSNRDEPLDLSIRDAAALLDVSPRTVQRHKHEIGYVLRNGQLRFRREDVEAYGRRGYVPAAVETPAAVVDIRQRRRAEKSAPGAVTGRVWGTR